MDLLYQSGQALQGGSNSNCTTTRKHGVDKKARSFTPWSHVVSMLYAQLTHSIGLNDVCDALGHHRGALSSIRGAEAPSRSGLSYATS